MNHWRILQGDCIELMAEISADSIDACVTDPPYGIGFMGKEWDTFKPGYRKDGWDYTLDTKGSLALHAADYDRSLRGQVGFQAWTARWVAAAWRVLKPGAHLLVCGAPRSFHRLACGIEDAGFEIRDCLSWLYGQGFPKSRNIGDGWGTALKPGWEPIIVARKPFKGSVKVNVGRYGTGAINIDGCRLNGAPPSVPQPQFNSPTGLVYGMKTGQGRNGEMSQSDLGRWPANMLLDKEAAALLDEQSGELTSGAIDFSRHTDSSSRSVYGGFPNGDRRTGAYKSNYGGASRFFYIAKPSREERDFGCEALGGNIHPTVKPVDLMRWLVRLVTPVGGTVLDPFCGSGTTGMAALYEGFNFIGIEREAEYREIARKRIGAVAPLLAREHSA